MAWLVFSLCAISLAMLIALTRLVLPLLVDDPDQVAAWIGSRIDRVVSIGEVRGDWVGLGPQLSLLDVGIAADDGTVLRVPRAELAIDLSALLSWRRSLSTFRLIGLDLELLLDADGRWQLSGFKGGGDSKLSMGALGALVLSDVRVRVRDQAGNFDLLLGSERLHVRSSGARMHLSGKVRHLDSDSVPLQVIVDMDQSRGAGELYLGAQGMDLGRISRDQGLPHLHMLAGVGDMQGWAQWRDRKVVSARVHVAMDSVVLQAGSDLVIDEGVQITPQAYLPRLAFDARLQRDGDVMQLDVLDLQLGEHEPARLSMNHQLGAPLGMLRLESLPLAPLADVAMLLGAVPHELRRWLYQASIHGVASVGRATWRGEDEFEAHLAVDGLLASADGMVPGFRVAHAQLYADQAGALLQLPEQKVELRMPGVFRKAFLFDALGGEISAWREGDGWQLAAPELAFVGEDYRGQLHGGVLLSAGEAPLLDLQAVVTGARVPAAKLFWPINKLGETAVQWLDDALVDGTVEHGRAVIRGPATHFPFDDGSGHFEASAMVTDAVLDYHPDWPRAEGISARARFINAGMDIEADAGQVLGNKADKASARIADFADTPLHLDVSGSGSGAQLLRFLRATPIGAGHAAHLAPVRVGGRGQLAFKLELPLGSEGQTKLDGGVMLRGASLDHDGYDLHFTDANGRVAFDQDGFQVSKMTMRHGADEAELDMAAGEHAGQDLAFSADLRSPFDVAELLQRVPALAPLQPRLSGRAQWHAALRVPAGPAHPQLLLESNLQGIGIDLPAPLGKPVRSQLPLRLSLPLPVEEGIVLASLGRRVAVAARLPTADRPLAVQARLGAAVAGSLPPRGIAIDGRTPQVEVDDWLAAITALRGDDSGGEVEEDGVELHSVDVRVDDLVIGERSLGLTQARLQPQVSGWQLDLDGSAMSGRVDVPRASSTQPLVAKFKRVYWPDATDVGSDPDTAGSAWDRLPQSLPPLQLDVDDLRAGEMRLGHFSWRSVPDSVGMDIQALTIKSPQMAIQASGSWRGNGGASTSRLQLQLEANDLGDMLESLGFAGLIAGGRTEVTSTLQWPGSPGAFDMAILDGELDARVGEGRILDVEPGAGRIFGLLSLREIPRRLSLDFSDFFRSGMSFNSITGHFDLRNGNASTDNLVIDSPAAHILITGRTGLRDKDYDQMMTVTPRAGAALPVVGALAGGPVGAAAGVVIQGILSKPLGEATRSQYHVGGTWDDPQITLQARDGAQQKPLPQPPAR